jgi:DNA modification methylase
MEPVVTPKSQPAGSGIKANDSFQTALKDIVDTRARRNSDWFFDSFQGLFSDEEGNPLALVVNSTGFSGAHYATYPPKLIEPCILAGCPRGGTVLDPFAGSGTTCFVSDRLGRHWIGIDMNCSIGKERIEKETKQRRLF